MFSFISIKKHYIFQKIYVNFTNYDVGGDDYIGPQDKMAFAAPFRTTRY